MSEMLKDRYQDRLAGVLSCCDLIVITGTLQGICYAPGTTNFLSAKGIRILDYPRFAEALREAIRKRAQTSAGAQGTRLESIAKAHIRREEMVAKMLATRSDHAGLVHVMSTMENCGSYKPQHDKITGKTFLKPDSGKCLHYYFIDDVLGLCYLQVLTWCPFRLQFYCNGQSGLARKLSAADTDFASADNAFIRVNDIDWAQALADSLKPDELHRRLNR